MKKIIDRTVKTCMAVAFASAASWAVADYSKHEKAPAFIDKMVSEHGFEREQIIAVLKQAKQQKSILEAIARPAEKTKEWHDYRKIFLGEKRVNQGVAFWNTHSDTIQKAADIYGVAPEVIVAIIGVETRYGRFMGNYGVINALATLGFDYEPRAKFFIGELEEAFLLAREQNVDPLSLKGSYAGAMGFGQFIPSSYRAYAVDFDEDEKVDIWENPVDAIGSVANYFKRHGWREGEPVFMRTQFPEKFEKEWVNARGKPSVTVTEWQARGIKATEPKTPGAAKASLLKYVGVEGEEYWFGFHNYYVITRYNRSRLYARAVYELSQEIKQGYSQQEK